MTSNDHKLSPITGELIMGLDMYLSAEKYIYENATEVKNVLAKIGFDTKDKEVKTIGVNIMQWRKANQIHRWFVENIQSYEDDCKRYFVDIESLNTLVSLCKKVSLNHSLAKELLPTQEGFFFGSYDYDDMYFFDIQETLGTLEPLLQDKNWLNWDFYYQSSW
jgi:uncharacterized protein YprB with RNaseH-like and TPR domain